MMKILHVTLAAVICCVGLASEAHASTMEFSHWTMGAKQQHLITYSGNRGVDVNTTNNVGQLIYTVGANSGPYYSPGDVITTFCIDIWDHASAGTANVGSLANTPLSGGANATMESYRADMLKVLWAQQYQNASDPRATNVIAAAFQLAIWEIAHEDNFTGNMMAGSAMAAGLNLADGAFIAGSKNALFEAQAMLDAAYMAWIDPDDPIHSKLPNLGAAFGANFQDVIIVIPLPAPVLMAAVGLLAIPLLRRVVWKPA